MLGSKVQLSFMMSFVKRCMCPKMWKLTGRCTYLNSWITQFYRIKPPKEKPIFDIAWIKQIISYKWSIFSKQPDNMIESVLFWNKHEFSRYYANSIDSRYPKKKKNSVHRQSWRWQQFSCNNKHLVVSLWAYAPGVSINWYIPMCDKMGCISVYSQLVSQLVL